MGMFDFLGKVFASKKEVKIEPPKEEQIPISNLESWFAAKEAELIKSAELVIRENCPKLQAAIKNCEADLIALKKAEPRYPQLYNQAKNIADGNRLAFTNSTENFLRSLKLPNSPSLLHDFVVASELNMTNFMADSNRSFIISNEFFTDQAVSVKTKLQEVDKLMQEMKCFCQKNKLAELKKAKEDITKLIKKIQQSQQLKDELGNVDARLVELLRQKETLRLEQSAFLQSSEFIEKQKLEFDLKDTQVQIKAKESELYSMFGTLDTPLRKLAWENPILKKQVNKYLNNPIEGVSDDQNFSFREILIKLRCAIEAGEIELRDKKRAQAIKDINVITESYIQIWLAMHKGLKAKEAELKEKLACSVVAKKELELKTHLQMLETEQENLNKQKGMLVAKINKASIDKEIEEVSNKLSSLTGQTIKISA